MKLKSLLYTILFTAAVLFSQAQTVDQGFKYQTAIRDQAGIIMANKLVGLKMSILQGNANGSEIYVETHKVSTSDFGIANLSIGAGTLVSGNFANIDWGNGPYFLKVELDLNNTNTYIFMGTSQLLAVPFALYAAKSANAENDYDKDSLNEVQQLTLNNHQLQLSKNGGTINLETYKDNTDSQKLSLQGNTLSISGGNSLVLAGAVDLDSDPTNELQELERKGDTIKLSKGNVIILDKDNDLDSTNELQTLQFSSDTLIISKGNKVKLPSDFDRDSLNEIQNIQIRNDTIFLSKSNFAILPKTFSVPSGTLITLDTFDRSLISKGYTFIGRGMNTIENIVSDSASWQWENVTNLNEAPEERHSHSAIWTGTDMIIYGRGTYIKEKKYNPATQTWKNISMINAPNSYLEYLATWTGTEMLLYSGHLDSTKIFRYNPSTD